MLLATVSLFVLLCACLVVVLAVLVHVFLASCCCACCAINSCSLLRFSSRWLCGAIVGKMSTYVNTTRKTGTGETAG